MVYIIAHRGLRSEQPENTIAAIEAALKLSLVSGVEFDTELTADGRLVVLHQETVVPDEEFRSVVPATRNFTSRDWVIEHAESELLALDAGAWFGKEFSDIRVPRLRDVLALEWNGRTPHVELKDATYWGERDASRPTKVVEAALPDLLTFKAPLSVISFNPLILALVGERAPHISRTLALWTEWEARHREAVTVARGCGASTISLPDVLAIKDPDWGSSLHGEGIQVHVYPVSPARGEPEFETWTASSQSDKWRHLAGRGVDAILSDFARETVAQLAG